MPPVTPLDRLRASLPAPGTPRFWRALDELASDPVRRPLLDAAMPAFAAMEPALDRRGFLRLLGASLAFAGLTACSGPPPERIVPQDGRPGRRTPATARYATGLSLGGDTVGVVVQLSEGRPIRVDGNPRHPASLGGSDARMQAAVLDLWDPARSTAPYRAGAPADWGTFEAEMATLRQPMAGHGAGLHIVSPALDSPTLARQHDALLARYPGAQWHVHEPAAADGAHSTYSLAEARVIVALDADLLGTMPMHLRHARDFAAGRADPGRMSRLYAIEPSPSLTGRNADHTWPASAHALPAIAAALAARLGAAATGSADVSGADASAAREAAAWGQRLDVLAADLRRHGKAALVVAGPAQPADVHASVRAINAVLGNAALIHPAEPPTVAAAPLTGLLQALQAGQVHTLVCLDSNPAYSCAGFAEAMRHAPQRIHLGRYRDETAMASVWHLPALHPFEAWSDLRSADGSATIVQPVLAPLVDGRTAHDVIDLLLGNATGEPLQRVRDTWPALAADDAWTTALRDGVFREDATPAIAVQGMKPLAAPATAAATGGATDTLEVIFRADEWLWDGRHAGNAWLQELPRPVSSLTWGNAAWISPALAAAHALADGDVVRLSAAGRAVELPVLIVPGQAADSITLTLGHGRREGLSKGIGTDVTAFRGPDEAWRLDGVALLPLNRREPLASTQMHQDMGKRDIIRVGTADRPPNFKPPANAASFYADKPAGEYRWGMTIDLNACIGCNACTVACQAENNIPVVGKEEVIRGRRMHWIRVDRYHAGSAVAPATYHQPVPCMHCEHAPCEVVCPTEATVHDSEGLNLQVYNRCIGTRFCANNCPYKVRRFNFLQYADFASESLKAMRNPEVTVRQKGVMEKCTYCVQRIEQAHIAADRDGRRIADGEVTTACQNACPTRAIVFGDLGDSTSAVSASATSPRRYVLLEELGTRPRTSYLAAVRNPNPAWGDA